MELISFIHDSFQEYEGYQSLVLFCNRCNLACKYCYNLDTIRKNDVKHDAIEIIDNHITPLHEAVVFLGGEPTLHGDLVDLLQYVKIMYSLKTKIFTNGMRPDVVSKCHGFLDYISIDFKCLNDTDILGIGISRELYLANIGECVEICSKNDIPIELRTTVYDGMSGVELDNIMEYSDTHFKSYIMDHIFQPEFKINL